MARLGLAALFLALAPTPGWAQSSEEFSPSLSLVARPGETLNRNFSLGSDAWPELENRIEIRANIGPNTNIGIGMFGHRREQSHRAPVTTRELAQPKSRRLAVGFSLKF